MRTQKFIGILIAEAFVFSVFQCGLAPTLGESGGHLGGVLEQIRSPEPNRPSDNKWPFTQILIATSLSF